MKKMTTPQFVASSKLDWAAIYAAPFGKIGVQTEMVDQSLMLSRIVYLDKTEKAIFPKNQLAHQVIEQIEAYLQNPNSIFDLPLKPKGTIFQERVWEVIRQIPLGDVLTYGSVAKKIQSAPRAVGGACGANPYPLIVPCHRVVGVNSIGGFAGEDREGYHRQIKTWLLHHEKVI